jgi:amino acid transporter
MIEQDGRAPGRPQGVVVGAVLVAAFVMLVAGAWCWVDPASFAAATNWPEHEHFLHDAGAFQMGIGITLLGALWWRDVLAVVLAGAVFTNGLHAVNHLMDRELGGRASDPWVIGLVALIALAGLVVRLRALRRLPAARS